MSTRRGELLASWTPLWVLLLALTLSQPSTAPAAEALTTQEIVKLHAAGASSRELRDRIRLAEQVAFDLSDDMIEELHEAGLPEDVLRAMLDRAGHEERKRRMLTPEDNPSSFPSGETGTLTIRLNPEIVNPKKRRLRAYDQADSSHDRRFQTDDNRYVDLGLFVACTTPDHVPDHWQTQTPIVNTFLPVPRHRLLTFVDGAAWTESRLFEGLRGHQDLGDAGQTAQVPYSERDRLGVLELALPMTLEATLVRGIVHDIVFGLAVATENGFTAWAVVERRDFVLDDATLELDASVRVRSKDLATTSISLEGAISQQQ